MSKPLLRIALSLLAAAAVAQSTAAETGLAAVRDLGVVNGQALACSVRQAAGRAKFLMLAHVPKTGRYGDAYERATQQAYLGQLEAPSGCPDAAALDRELDRIALRLREAFAVPPPR